MRREMAIRGTRDFVMAELSRFIDTRNNRAILDIGAGEGALSVRLKEDGLSVSACDLDPGLFDVPGIECRRCDKAG